MVMKIRKRILIISLTLLAGFYLFGRGSDKGHEESH